MTPARKKILGLLISLPCILYIFYEIFEQREIIREIDFTLSFALAGLFGIAIWTFANVLLGASWFMLLQWFGLKAPISLALCATLKTQVAKYLPGNVLHYAGRILLAKWTGFPARIVTVTLFVEVVFQFLAALFVALPLISRILPGFHPLYPILLIVILVAILFPKLRKRVTGVFLDGGERTLFKGKNWIYPLCSLLALTLIFPLCGIALVNLAPHILGGTVPPYAQLTSAFALSWAIAFILPAAPGGLGVREAIFVYLMKESSKTGEVALLAICLRIVFMLGDAASLALSQIINPEAGEDLQD